MRRASVRIQQLLGLDRNRVGDADQLAPDHLLNLVDSRGGGYTPAGAWHGTPDSGWASSVYPQLVGSDAVGLASLRSTVSGSPVQARFGLVRANGSFVQGELAGGDGAGTHYGAHIPGVGAYASISRFLVEDRSGNVVEPQDFASGSGFTAPGVGSASEAPNYDTIQGFTAQVVDAGYDSVNDRWLVIGRLGGDMQFAYRDGDGPWTVGTYSSADPSALTRTATHWIVVGFNGLVLNSADGASWTDHSFGSQRFMDVAADGVAGRAWVIETVHTSGVKCWVTTNSGQNWTATTVSLSPGGRSFGSDTTARPGDYAFPTAVVYEPVTNELMFMVSMTGINPDSTLPWVWRFDPSDLTEVVHFNPVSMPSAVEGSSMHGPVRLERGWSGFGVGGGRVIAWVNRAASASVTTPAGGGMVEVPVGGPPPRTVIGILASDSWFVGAVRFGDRWVALDSATPGGFAVGSDDTQWEVSEFSDGPYGALVTDGDTALAVGSGSTAEWVPAGLAQMGRYEFIALTSLMTAAGKLVVNVFKGDAWVTSAESSVASAHDWSGATPAFDVNLTTDVYVRFTPRVFDEVLGQWVINEPVGGFTHAASLTSGESWAVDAPGVGSQVLGISGGVAVAAFRNSGGENVVAEHNGRVWFQAGGSYAWSVLMGAFDFPTLEDERTVTFSVGGFVNLVELDGWIRFSATQSTSLNGLLPSSQGLLVLFDNEVFSLSGDVALSNLQALLFPDNVGLTAGCKAVLAGGVPITLWRGKLWALQSGMAQDVAAPVWRADDPFIDVVSDPLTRSVVALTSDRELLSLKTDSGFWFELPALPAGAGSASRLVGNPTGFRAWAVGSTNTVPRRFDSAATTITAPEVAWLGLDAGDPMRRDNWLNIRFVIEGDGAATPAAAPVVYFRPSDAGSAIPSVFDKNVTYRALGVRRGDEWWFKLPVGLKSRKLDVLFVFTGFTRDAVIEPGFDFTILPGHLEGRRPQVQ